jgi:hypothetical protein
VFSSLYGKKCNGHRLLIGIQIGQYKVHVSTGILYTAFRKISGFMSLKLDDIAYDTSLGSTVRKQWKELILKGRMRIKTIP